MDRSYKLLIASFTGKSFIKMLLLGIFLLVIPGYNLPKSLIFYYTKIESMHHITGNYSSIVIEVIRTVFYFFIFYEIVLNI